MRTADSVNYVGFLEGVPSFSLCTTEVLEKFLAYDAMRAHCEPGEVLCGLQQDHNLYVLTSGTAELHVTPDITITLTPGDYFGQEPERHHRMAGTVVAKTAVEVLVIGPQEIAQLELASSASRHPSRAEWPLERSTLTQRRRRTLRRALLVRHAH
jgi:CRP-like cAMP-binding protein